VENFEISSAMNRATRILVMALAAVMGGCSSMEISVDYDPEVTFASLQTYGWLDRPQKATGDPRIDGNTILEKRIRDAVDTELATRGFRKVTSDPDFLVAYHVSLDKRRSVQTLNSYYGYGAGWGYGYGASYRPGYWAGAPETYVYEYEEGTLILDIVNPDNKELIWRGSATDEVHFKSTPEKDQTQLNEAVRKMLEKFPPG
jgi:Domain of unknown function (DUF4136)